MGVHNNIHVPKDSWPAFAWYAIEFFVVLAVGIFIALYSMDFFAKYHFTPEVNNFAFWGIVGIPFLVYYLLIRPFILKRPALRI